MFLPRCLFVALAVCANLSSQGATPDRRVVLMVWDGLRPDFVTPEVTPNLYALAARGVFFKNHHSSYPGATEVNGTALATGGHPASSGIVGNREYRPAINPLESVDTQAPDTVQKGDVLTNGHYLLLPTLAARVQSAGLRTAVAGTKSVVLLHDRPAGRRGATSPPSIVLFTKDISATPSAPRRTISLTVPDGALPTLVPMDDPIPENITYPNERQDEWTTRMMVERLWRDGVPAFSLLWLSEPDFTQHQHGPGSGPALAALRSADRNLGRVLAALEMRGMRDAVDILVVSDHGFSTVSARADVARALRDAGVDARREFTEPPAPGQVFVVGHGGSVFLYVIGHDQVLAKRIIEVLQNSDFAGTILTREAMPGTHRLSDVRMDSEEAPDIVVSMRWTPAKGAHGTPGTIISDGGRMPGGGNHASLSVFDQHNTLIAAGRDFRVGLESELPSGNIDVAPTILRLLALKPEAPCDGRVLFEALREEIAEKPLPPRTERTEASSIVAKGVWRQYLQLTRYAGALYVDEGNAAIAPAAIKTSADAN